ncbi:kelch repeat-containing protein [Archangium sp.]|uniref:kelch repeat-containing protein n=1 Tax=Archangium sp. TaxID=1872627 RepID=UPI002ED9AE36
MPPRRQPLLLSLALAFLMSAAPSHAAEAPVGVATGSSWSVTGSLLQARYLHTATRLLSGKVLVTGGQQPTFVALATAELYDPGTGTWSATAPMSRARSEHTATLLPSGKVLVTGGQDAGKSTNTAELYDPETGTWSATASMSWARGEHTATLLPSGKVLVTGSWGAGESAKTAELYDPETGTWSPTGSMASGRGNHQAVLLSSGRVLVLGGSGEDGTLATVEQYDPETGQWSPRGSMTWERQRFSALVLPSGKVLAAGGLSVRVFEYDTAELYDPGTDTWSTTSRMSSTHGNHAATLLPSGKVLISGGSGLGREPCSADLYEPETDTWSCAELPRPSLRGFLTATLLYSGRVLTAGGFKSPTLHATAELSPDEGRTPPRVWPLQVTTAEDIPVPVVLEGADADGDALTYTVLAGPPHGTLSGTAPHLTYTPAPDFTGTDTLLYKVNDGTLDSSPIAVRLVVTPVEDPPRALPLSVSTPLGTPVEVTLPGMDPDGDALTYTLLSQPEHGRLTGSAPHLTYRPPRGGYGQDSFRYKVSDGGRESEVATVSLTITPGPEVGSCAAPGGGTSWAALVLLGLALHPRRRSRRG